MSDHESPNTKVFKLNPKFLSTASDIAIAVTPPAGGELAAALATNQPFPDRQIELGNISIRAETGKDIEFLSPKGAVRFSGRGGAFAGLGVFQDPAKMLDTLRRDPDGTSIVAELELEKDELHNYVLLRWGYDIEAAAKGSVALGVGGSVKFGVTGRRDGLYAVVRRLDKTLGAASAVTETISSWALPSLVDSADALKPGSWLIAEVDGSLALSLAAQYGYDFNWVREAVQADGLTGDIGLRIQLGVTASLGFQASGQYAVILSRESLKPEDRCLRLRLCKLSKKGWEFAFTAGAEVETDFDKLLPGKFDDFIAGVFGVHGLQVLKDLDKWTDPNEQLSGLLSEVGIDYAQKFLHDATGIDPKTEFETAKARLQDLLKKWRVLPHRVAGVLWTIVDQKQNLAPFRDFLGKLAAGDNAIQGELQELLGRVDFFRTPAGMWLEAVTEVGLLTALGDAKEFEKVKDIARQTAGILDGAVVERTLTNLQTFIGQHLRLDQIENVVNETDFQRVDQWLKARLSAFLGKKLDVSQLEKVRTAVHLLLERREQLFSKAREALTRKYQLEFLEVYQKTTTGGALIDVEFDFNAGEPSAGQLLRKALDGDFNTLLVQKVKGISLHKAALTHEIRRQSHVEVTLPYFKTVLDHINSSLARVDAVDSEGERVLLYELDAKDRLTKKDAFDSHLAVGAHLAAGEGIRVHQQDSMTYSYSFRQAVRNMSRSHLEFQLKPYVSEYFPSAFEGNGKQPFSTFIGDMDTVVEEIVQNGKDNFGHTLISLELTLPGSVVASWKNAPVQKNAQEYMAMSISLQAMLKRMIPFCYFQDPSKYGDLLPASVLLIYASIPPSTAIRLQHGKIEQTTRDIYWDFADDRQRTAMVTSASTLVTLTSKLVDVQHLISTTPGQQKNAQFYKPDQVSRDRILNDVLNKSAGKTLLNSLLFVEAEVVQGARDAGLKMARFLKHAGVKPSEAVKALAEFGAKLTDTFNKRISSVYRGDALRPLGTMAFVEAARALDPAALQTSANALLELIVLKDDTSFPLDNFLKRESPEPNDIVLQQRLVNLGAPIA